MSVDAWSADEIRRVGYRAVDLIVEHLEVRSFPGFPGPATNKIGTPDRTLDDFPTPGAEVHHSECRERILRGTIFSIPRSFGVILQIEPDLSMAKLIRTNFYAFNFRIEFLFWNRKKLRQRQSVCNAT